MSPVPSKATWLRLPFALVRTKSLLRSHVLVLSLSLVVLPTTIKSASDVDIQRLMDDMLKQLLPQSVTGVRGELVVRQTVTLSANISVAFPTKFNAADGSLSYKTLKPEAGALLVEDPVVDVPPGLKARITELKAEPSNVRLGRGEIEGFRIKCTADITTVGNPRPGHYSVIVAFPEIVRVAKAIEAIPPSTTPMLSFNVQVFESELAREKAKEAELARLEKERLEQEAAARESEARRVAEEAAEAAKRRRIYVWLGIGAVALLTVCLLGAQVSAWMFPKHRMRVRPGGKANSKGSVERKNPLKKEEIAAASITPFTETVPARSFFGSKVNVSVNLSPISADRSVNEITTTTTHDGGGSSVSVSYEEIVKYQVMITALAGSDAKQGRCMARTAAGTVLIHVE